MKVFDALHVSDTNEAISYVLDRLRDKGISLINEPDQETIQMVEENVLPKLNEFPEPDWEDGVDPLTDQVCNLLTMVTNELIKGYFRPVFIEILNEEYPGLVRVK